MAAAPLEAIDDDALGCIIDVGTGLSPADLAALACCSRALRDAVGRARPARLAVRACSSDPAPLAWALARLRTASALALDCSPDPGALAAVSGALTRPDACPRLRDLTLAAASPGGDAAPAPARAVDLLPPAGRLTSLALHGVPLDTAGLADTPAGRGLRALDLDTRHAGPLWRPLYALPSLAALALGTATPALASLALRVGSGFGEVTGAGRPLGGGEAGEGPLIPVSADRLFGGVPAAAALPTRSLTSLRLLAASPQASPLQAAVAGLVAALPALASLDITNTLGGAPHAPTLLGMRSGGDRGGGGSGGGAPTGLAVRLAGARSPFDPITDQAPPSPPPRPPGRGAPSTPAGARLVSLSLGSGRPMSAGGLAGPPGVGGSAIDLAPLARPGAAPCLADLELRDYGRVRGLPSLAAAAAAGHCVGLTRLALRVHRRFAREGAAMGVDWPVCADSAPTVFAGMRTLEVSLGEVHPDWRLVAVGGRGSGGGSGGGGGGSGRGGGGGSGATAASPPHSLPPPGTPAHASLLRSVGEALGAHLDAACFISAGGRVEAGRAADPFEAGVLAAFRTGPAAPPRVVLVPEGGGGGVDAEDWAPPHPPLRLAFTDAGLLAGPALGCAAAGLPAGVVAAVWGGRGAGGSGAGWQAAWYDVGVLPPAA